jgi:hypothetical protein
MRLTFSQTHIITSPRDDGSKPITSTRNFILIEEGKRPPKEHIHTGKDAPCLWKGTDAGGKSTGELRIESKGRLPNDDHGRPSTLPGLVTPIKVSHTIVVEVWFSVYGETEEAKPMYKPGPGGVRVLRIQRAVIVPSVSEI